MKTLLLFLLLLAAPLFGASPYPDKKLTPGAIDPAATQQKVIKVGYTVDARHVTDDTKWQVLVRYKMASGKLDHKKLSTLLKDFEIDHMISLELGGSNVVVNLWPQPYTCDVKGENMGARQKDVVETTLHRMMRKGTLTLPQAQKIILTDWVLAYHQIKANKPLTTYK